MNADDIGDDDNGAPVIGDADAVARAREDVADDVLADSREDAFASARAARSKATPRVAVDDDGQPKRGRGRPPTDMSPEAVARRKRRNARERAKRGDRADDPASGGEGVGSGDEAAGLSSFARHSRKTRAMLEEELEAAARERDTLAAQLAARTDEELSRALAETWSSAWDAVRTFAPNPTAPMAPDKREALGAVWSPVVAPYVSRIAGAVPVVLAVGMTYRIFAPLVRDGWRAPDEGAGVIVAGTGAGGANLPRDGIARPRGAQPEREVPPPHIDDSSPLDLRDGYSPSDGGGQ